MPLTLLSSNRVEILQASLLRRLLDEPLADPFTPEVIVVPTFALARWLNLRFAAQQGIAANQHYSQPARWVWQMANDVLGDLPDEDPWSRDALGWRLFSNLPEMLGEAAFASLRHYLGDDTDGIKRWQLCERIAASFDRYQSFRPEMIRDWSRGCENHWQAKLWRALVAEAGETHRVAVLERFYAAFEKPDHPPLPSRVSLFALSTLPPLYLEVLRVLAPHTDLHLYLHSPSDQYWADLETQKRRARRRLERDGEEEQALAGNELLASWGRQGQIFQDQLLGRVETDAVDVENFSPPGGSSLLERLQESIFSLDTRIRVLPVDDSISLHVCHSPMRECQVLLDNLLDMLEQDTTLNPEDILVMVPDIAAYAPYIEAVFRAQPIGFNLSDITLADEHPLVTTFLQLLQLPASRFTQQEILALLDNESLRRRFEIDETALADVHHLVERGHTRWGLDAAHKAEFGLPETAGNTWRQLHERFFAGFALAGDEVWQGIAPLPVEDDAAAPALGRFWHFLRQLRAWRERLGKTRRATEWQRLLMQSLEDFFVEPDPRDSRLQQIRDAIGRLGEGGGNLLSPALMVYQMRRLLQSTEQSGQLYSGGITFCGMRPMRSIPFRVICLLGMNRDDFPRRDPPSDFEIVSPKPAASDPGPRSEDRYLMLETLLCARQKLYISYSGRSLRDNSESQPSVLVQELMDFIDSHFEAAECRRIPSQSLIRVHPMQVFSTANFIAPKFSYRGYWLDIARRIGGERDAKRQPWPTRALEASAPDDDIDLEHLRRFVADPVKYFFRRRLGIYLESEDTASVDEPFLPTGLEAWKLRQRLGEDCLDGAGASVERLQAEGLLAHGPAATIQLERLQREAADWLASIEAFRGVSRQALAIDIGFDSGLHLTGSLSDYFAGRGLMGFHAGKFRGHHLLGLWIDHLALCTAGFAHQDHSSLFIASDSRWRIPALPPEAARERLADYVQLYGEGLCRPLPVFPQISHLWATLAERDRALEAANKKWHDVWTRGGDRDNSYLHLVLQAGYELPFAEPEFDRCARRLYDDLLARVEQL